MFKGGVETQGFFSLRLEKRLRELGHDTLMYDYEKEAASSMELLRFYRPGQTVMLTFNFHGICNEDILRDESGLYIWEALGIPCINIVVDHPFYYDRFMEQLPKYYIQISIDRNHEDFLRRFYPHIKTGPFLPLGGTRLEGCPLIPLDKRSRDIIITGSWVDPAFYEGYMRQEGPEYSDFYHRVLDRLLLEPHLTLEEVFEPMIRMEAEDADQMTDDMLREAYSHLVCIDMYIRYYFRGELIRLLAESGLQILCVGGGWNELECSRKENIIHMDYTSSLECLKLIADSRISLNVMPWFKRGAHDRIFNSMLQGAVCFTDSSQYLDTILRDGVNCLEFSLDNMEEAADIIKNALADAELLRNIADSGYELAANGHTWAHRADELHSYIEDLPMP